MPAQVRGTDLVISERIDARTPCLLPIALRGTDVALLFGQERPASNAVTHAPSSAARQSDIGC